MSYKQYAGPRVYRRQQRRLVKSGLLAGLLAGLLLTGTWTTWTPPALEQSLCEQEVVMARNLYVISGDRGYAHEYLQKSSPEQAAYILTGK